MERVEILQGDCLDVLPTLQRESVDCCVTSPPYWRLRDYGSHEQIGMEDTIEEYVGRLVDVFRAVRDVLKPDGTVWLNLGDTYASNRSCQVPDGKHVDVGNNMPMRVPDGLKPKDLCGIPWRVAFALQADGWWLRQDIIWHKTRPMPESVRDRCTRSHEYIFLLSKSEKYYFDSKSIEEMSSYEWNSARSSFTMGPKGESLAASGNRLRCAGSFHRDEWRGTRKKRSVWSVPSEPFHGAHFAVFPPGLIKPCILAGSREGGVVLDPFAGSGTTGVVASSAGRNAVLIELNPQYADMARMRVNDSMENMRMF